MKQLFCICFLLCSSVVCAQTVESPIYICTDALGAVRLSNLNASKGCVVRLVQTPVSARRVSTPMMNDPQPAANALIVPVGLQMHRDDARKQILHAELRQSLQSLVALQSEYQNGAPERLGSERNHQKYLDRIQDLKHKIQWTQDNISALQREIGRE